MDRPTPIKSRPLRFGMRVQVTEPSHFYYGLYGTLTAAACHEPFYQVSFDVMPEQEAWVEGECLTPLNKGEDGYEPDDPLPEVYIEIED